METTVVSEPPTARSTRSQGKRGLLFDLTAGTYFHDASNTVFNIFGSVFRPTPMPRPRPPRPGWVTTQ